MISFQKQSYRYYVCKGRTLRWQFKEEKSHKFIMHAVWSIEFDPSCFKSCADIDSSYMPALLVKQPSTVMFPAWDEAAWVHISGSGNVHLCSLFPRGCWKPGGPKPRCCHPCLPLLSSLWVCCASRDAAPPSHTPWRAGTSAPLQGQPVPAGSSGQSKCILTT